MPCFTAMRAEIALMSGSAFAVTHHAFSSGAGRTSDGNGSHASTLKSPSYTKSVSWQHYLPFEMNPKVYNPLSGYIANWNNSPQKDYPASDLFAFLWGGRSRYGDRPTA
ncbi:putative IS1 encoded protein [Shigella flexneri K-315]|uniref:Putative IS1 encoded protein n=1 Tax=Shigella flexneri K-315 TaxID=766150 RepID=I6C7I9_SHIFL|nr:putative IS1 encoded protein [Shigella flexneri K-315]